MAEVTFWGATGQVTGSCYLVRTGNATVLLECGLVQGSREDEEANSKPFPFDVGRIDAVVLSHAHLDHSGRIPRLVKDGFSGPIYMTDATGDLLEVMLKDAAFLAERDAEWENKRLRRAGRAEIPPLYTVDDVELALAQCEGVAYHERRQVADGIEVYFRDAGHILGSAIVELLVRDGGETRRLVFSGDLGNSCAALLRDPEAVGEADVLLLESTYGDRDHRPLDATLEEFEDTFKQAQQSGGNVLIPAFAVGRTQEIIFRLGELYQRGALQQGVVFLDSPMAIAATEIYHRYQRMFNAEDSAQLRRTRSPTLHSFLPPLRYSRTAEESMAINRVSEGAIIVAGSGMCTGGRIRHHLKHNLWRREAHVIIVGFQAIGTPGRALVDGARHLTLAGEEIVVKATVHTIGGFSAHAGQSQLLDWANGFGTRRPRLYLVHGEPDKRAALREQFASRYQWDAALPAYGESVRL
ncbi:MAG: MBL fold metallo-hydrolase [Gammaproteobacteria bacterium]|nr:MAG: MBL fold metallo-hydrolase [Gammaproteobacteria bacterium]